MNCPVCEDTRMREVEKEGIMIDVCPSCKGVWLDRGELDKLMQNVREVRQDYNEWYYGDDQQIPPASAPQQPYSQPPQQTYNAPPQQQPYPQQQYQQQYPQQQHPQQQPYYGDKSHKHSHYPPHYKKKKKSVMDIFGDLFD